MRVQLQAVSLRMQSLRSNEQMAVAMRGATRVRVTDVIPGGHRCLIRALVALRQAMGQMNRQMNLPQVRPEALPKDPPRLTLFFRDQIQRIMNEFEKESSTMDMKEEMMSDAVDDVMDDEAEGEGEEAEGDKVLKEVLDEIGIDMSQMVSREPIGRAVLKLIGCS